MSTIDKTTKFLLSSVRGMSHNTRLLVLIIIDAIILKDEFTYVD